jgi:hypothetical protein
MGPELVRTVDCIDVAVIGEGDETFPRLLSALVAGADLDAVPDAPRRAVRAGPCRARNQGTITRRRQATSTAVAS